MIQINNPSLKQISPFHEECEKHTKGWVKIAIHQLKQIYICIKNTVSIPPWNNDKCYLMTPRVIRIKTIDAS